MDSVDPYSYSLVTCEWHIAIYSQICMKNINDTAIYYKKA